MKKSILLTFALLLFFRHALPQSNVFTVEAYKAFLAEHQNLSSSQLISLHSAGTFKDRLNLNPNEAAYLDSITAKYALTEAEINLIRRNGFMVSQRLSRKSFGQAFGEIWHKDLPLFISTDAILHAIHMSYDAILKRIETQVLIPKLTTLLDEMKKQIAPLHAKYSSNSAMIISLEDADLYLTVAQKLLGSPSSLYYSSNQEALTNILAYVAAEKPVSHKLFSSTQKMIDYSQFKVRGHYTDQNFPQLAKYFQAMIWLGRIELYLIPPVASGSPQQSWQDIQRQIIDAVLLNEAIQGAAMQKTWSDIDDIIKFMVGESDNVTLVNLQDVISATGITAASELTDSSTVVKFQDTLRTKSYAFQRILSQILMTGFNDPDNIDPASAFLLFGQRFIIDSYVTGQVVFDKIVYENMKPKRMLPSPLDILFALGNNGAAQLLKKELDDYHYSTNLAALRYLVDGYESDFWDATLYNCWLNSIRTLNPPDDRSTLPLFMQTAGWWQEKMNTQLASWAQLRHDNLLYAKQSYTGGVICSYPYVYVEPNPQFYATVKAFANRAEEYFKEMSGAEEAAYYFSNVSKICDTLASVAEKELTNENLSDKEKTFLAKTLYDVNICGVQFDGWYRHLYFLGENAMLKEDIVVADVHTAPTDALGNPVGWVLHAGTGPINMGVFVAESENKSIAFVGPVMSYYEHVTTNFHRFTDEEWATAYALAPSFRPSFVNIYLADSTGNSLGEGTNLATSVYDDHTVTQIPHTPVLAQNFPNPFNSSTIIRFSIPHQLSGFPVALTVYDVQGRVVKRLVNAPVPAGNYFTKWDGTDETGKPVSSGVYIYRLMAGTNSMAWKMILAK